MGDSAVNSLNRRDLLGFFAHPGTADEYLKRINCEISRGNSSTIYYHNMHTVYVYLTNETYRESFQDKLVIVDGMVLLFLHKLAGYRLSRNCRVTYVEFIIPLMTLARDQDWRVFHVGQNETALESALSTIRDRVPGINISGHHGYFDVSSASRDTELVIEKINAFKPDLMLVGLGTPMQELWVDENRHRINASVVMTCGSCMDYLAGKVKAAPRWMSHLGLEAIYRVYADPRRLAYRYLVEPVLLIKVLLRNRFLR